MADEIRVNTAGTTEADATVVQSRPVTTPNDPNAARAEIEATRARMSETIDEIEEVLLRKKESIEDRLDIFAPVRERPMQTLGAVFGAGLVLGLLTGGGDDEEEDEEEVRFRSNGWDRAETWEDRARRLLRIAREQEEELELLRSRAYPTRAEPRPVIAMDDEVDEEDPETMLGRLRDMAVDRLSGWVADSVHRMMRGH